jgi:hypothetical protein
MVRDQHGRDWSECAFAHSFSEFVFFVLKRQTCRLWRGGTMEGLPVMVILLLLIVMAVVLTEATGTKPPPATFTLGDSLVDVGNNNYFFTLAQANHKPYGIDRADQLATGRFCNGRIIPDLLSKWVSVTELFLRAMFLPYLSVVNLGVFHFIILTRRVEYVIISHNLSFRFLF